MIPDSFNLENEPTPVKESLAVIPQAGTLDLRLADCMDVMKEFPDKHFDLAIVDPPYGIGAENHAGKAENGWTQWSKKQWDAYPPDIQYFTELFRVSKNQIVWGANYYPQYLSPSMGWIFWDKGQRNFSLADGELAFSSFDKAMRVFDFSRGGQMAEGQRIHPTQKPVALYKWLLKNYATPGQRILDTHLGSGSHAIACHYAGMHLTACEIDADYFEAAKERIKRETSQLDLFC
jgi:site-specific DNA-methyltransferase (adenine-specific)